MNKYYCISFEGLDRTGKGQIGKYVDILGKHKYVLMDRGIMSNITYARMYGRDYQYDIDQFKPWTFAYFVCDEEDWQVRCKMSNEPAIDFVQNLEEFEKTRMMFEQKGFDVLFINTSRISPYDAALKIIQHMEKKNAMNATE